MKGKTMDFVCSYCGKICKNHNSWRNHERLCKHNPSRQFIKFSFKKGEENPNAFKVKCKYCLKEFAKPNIKIHEKNCPLNPDNKKIVRFAVI
jgi:aspartate carbamoyltransferase regulatory subunit